MRELYITLQGLLNKVNFSAIWPEFHPYPFALYNESTVYLENGTIPHDNRFLGNTAIEYNGGYMAIWHIGENEPIAAIDCEEIAANMVHEMFHAMQREKGEMRFPNDMQTLTYSLEGRNFSMRQMEFNLLCAAVNATEAAYIAQQLGQIAALRVLRKDIIGDVIMQEYFIETVEGMAEYAGMCALKQLVNQKYEKRLQQYCLKLREGGIAAFDVRRMAYYSGALMLIAAHEAGLDFAHDIGSEMRPVFELLCAKLPMAQAALDALPNVQATLDEYKTALKARFDAFFSEERKHINGDFCICGYDPMNMVRQGDDVLCLHFIMLQENGGEAQFIKGPVLLNMEKGETYKVIGYSV